MKIRSALFLLLTAVAAVAAEQPKPQEFTFVEEMWAKSDVPGGQDPKITITLLDNPSTLFLSVLVYEYRDKQFIGLAPPSAPSNKFWMCDDLAISSGACKEGQRYRFLIEETTDMMYPSNPRFHYSVPSSTLLSNQTKTFEYIPPKRGIYFILVAQIRTGGTYNYLIESDINVLFQKDSVNPYGRLPALEYPYLPFYGILSLVYLTIGVVWLVKSAMHWREILPVQNYIAGVIFILMLDYALQYGFMENYNLNGLPSKSFMGGVVFVNSLRNSVSLFLLLIVALGYGVVKPSLGTDMRICIGLAVAVFISVVIFNVGILVESVRDSFFLSLLCIFPLALTLSFTITRIMNALKATLVHLEARRQTYKITMYKRLRLVLAVVVSFGAISLLTSVGITGSASRDLVAWKATYMTSYWFFRDGWMNIIYFCGFISIILLWRPTSNNARYGLEELPEHADGGAYDLEMTTGYDSGQEMKRRNPANNNTQQSQKRNDVVFELDTENESPDELMGNNNHSAIKNAVVSDSDGGGDMSLSPTSTNGGQKLQ